MKKCSDCQLWDKKEGDCTAIPTDLGGVCLLRHILWELEVLSGIMEDKSADKDEDENDGDWWKKKG
jgi:hypothetical protein